jgi:hypothetical protein
LRATLLRLDRIESAKAGAKRALRALAGFAKLKLSYHDVEVGIDLSPEPGLADSGDLELDLTDLFAAVGEAAKERGTAVVLYMDEIQYIREQELAAFIAAMHATAQADLPLTMVGAGLPQLLAQMGRAKSYSERLFEFHEVAKLNPGAAANAITLPIEREDEEIEPEAVRAIVEATQGYPYYIQEFAKHAWDLAFCSPITLQDVANATVTAVAELDASFFRVRFDRLTPTEKRYMRAMAGLGPGPHPSGDIADVLAKQVTQLAPIRNSLIKKGMLYSPAHGDTAFTVPMFDEFMKRIMPDAG